MQAVLRADKVVRTTFLTVIFITPIVFLGMFNVPFLKSLTNSLLPGLLRPELIFLVSTVDPYLVKEVLFDILLAALAALVLCTDRSFRLDRGAVLLPAFFVYAFAAGASQRYPFRLGRPDDFDAGDERCLRKLRAHCCRFSTRGSSAGLRKYLHHRYVQDLPRRGVREFAAFRIRGSGLRRTLRDTKSLQQVRQRKGRSYAEQDDADDDDMEKHSEQTNRHQQAGCL